MTPAEARLALAALDGLITATGLIASQIAQARKEGLVTAAEQRQRLNRVDTLRKRLQASRFQPSESKKQISDGGPRR